MYVLVYLFFNTLSIHVKLMNEMQIDDTCPRPGKFKINKQEEEERRNLNGGHEGYKGRKIYT